MFCHCLCHVISHRYERNRWLSSMALSTWKDFSLLGQLLSDILLSPFKRTVPRISFLKLLFGGCLQNCSERKSQSVCICSEKSRSLCSVLNMSLVKIIWLLIWQSSQRDSKGQCNAFAKHRLRSHLTRSFLFASFQCIVTRSEVVVSLIAQGQSILVD